MPPLVSRLMSLDLVYYRTLLFTLNSGVGSAVLYAVPRSDCSTFGVDMMEKRGEMVYGMGAQMMMRVWLWSVRIGNAELKHGNMLESPLVNELLTRADVSS